MRPKYAQVFDQLSALVGEQYGLSFVVCPVVGQRLNLGADWWRVDRLVWICRVGVVNSD